jgi:transposase
VERPAPAGRRNSFWLPDLRREDSAATLQPGDIVIMANLGSHKGKIIRRLIRSVGAKLLFLPKYSPDLNPIEQVFAKLKHLLRKAAARTVETVCTAIGQLLGTFTNEECANYLKNSGYGPPKCITL